MRQSPQQTVSPGQINRNMCYDFRELFMSVQDLGSRLYVGFVDNYNDSPSSALFFTAKYTSGFSWVNNFSLCIMGL